MRLALLRTSMAVPGRYSQPTLCIGAISHSVTRRMLMIRVTKMTRTLIVSLQPYSPVVDPQVPEGSGCYNLGTLLWY